LPPCNRAESSESLSASEALLRDGVIAGSVFFGNNGAGDRHEELSQVAIGSQEGIFLDSFPGQVEFGAHVLL